MNFISHLLFVGMRIYLIELMLYLDEQVMSSIFKLESVVTCGDLGCCERPLGTDADNSPVGSNNTVENDASAPLRRKREESL